MGKEENVEIPGIDEDPPIQEDYLDFELEIGVGSGRVYPVAVTHSAAGEAHEIMDFPYDDLALNNQLLTLQNALLRSGGQSRHVMLPEEESVQDFGLTLFKILFAGEIGHCYAISQREASQQGKGLRLKLRILSPELAGLPWEYLYDPSRAEYICLSRNTPVVRYLELPQPPQPLSVTLPLRILGMIATPTNLPALDVRREQERMEKALEPLQQRGLVQLTWLSGQTWRDVQQAMREGPWHIFHFIGHGSFDPVADEGLIAFADEQGQADLFRATQLARLLADHRSLRLVVLNACESAKGGRHDVFSSAAANLVRHGIPAVLAMQYTITDAAAIVFSRAFYEALADGIPIDAAVGEARKAVCFEVTNTLEWGIPVLFMRSPDGVLFTVKSETATTLRQHPKPLTIPQETQVPAMKQPATHPSVQPSPRVEIPQPEPQIPHRTFSRGGILLLIALACTLIVGSVATFLLISSNNSHSNTQVTQTVSQNATEQGNPTVVATTPVVTEQVVPPLQTPTQLSPSDGSVFNNYPRTTTLQWSAVDNAVSYTVEIDCYNCCEVGQWCTDVGRTWDIVSDIRQTTYTFNFVGAQPGRWRVLAVDASGQKSSFSGWWTFTYSV